MTTPTLRRIKDDVIVTGPDIAPTKFKSRPHCGHDRESSSRANDRVCGSCSNSEPAPRGRRRIRRQELLLWFRRTGNVKRHRSCLSASGR